MEITYIFRAQSAQRSIERVFEPIIQEMILAGHRVDIQYATLGAGLFSTLWKNIRYFSKLSKRTLCHITGDVQYVACLMKPENTILTIHDLVPLHNKNVPWYSKWLCYWLWYYIPLKRLKLVTCISEATRQDLISFFPWAKDKIVVIQNPVSPDFQYVPKDFNAECPRILHIGTNSNKNLVRVIEAIKGEKYHLRIIGRIPEKELELLNKYNISYSNEVFVSDEQILQEYIDCDIVSFPSLFEGFGMPIIEGQSVGRVVITSDIAPMKAVAGKGAVLINPYSVDSLKDGISRIINDASYRENVIQEGCKNAKQYAASFVLSKYLNIYKRF